MKKILKNASELKGTMPSKKQLLQKLQKEIKSYFPNEELVFGHGNINSKIMLLGEAPGAEEVIQGKPFVGRSGRLLTKTLEKNKIDRNKIYITNVVKWRPPFNKTPKTSEIKESLLYLEKEILIVKPKIICPLGNTALKALTEKGNVTKVRGKIATEEIEGQKFLLLPTFHPAAILRNINRLPMFEKDLKKLKKYL